MWRSHISSNLKPKLFEYILECDLLSGQGTPIQFLCHVWFRLVVDGRQGRRLSMRMQVSLDTPFSHLG